MMQIKEEKVGREQKLDADVLLASVVNWLIEHWWLTCMYMGESTGQQNALQDGCYTNIIQGKFCSPIESCTGRQAMF